MSTNYVSNSNLLEDIIKWKESGEKTMPNCIGKSVIQIANGLAKDGRFRGYTKSWKDEMISDAILACCAYLHNFNPEKYNNPFAYISKICYCAFIGRIKKEKQKLAVVEEYKNHCNDFFAIDEDDEDGYEYITNSARIANMAYSKQTSKKAVVPGAIDTFME